MVVNWKAPDANERLMGALLAAHTEFKPDYHKIASVFGRGATYNSVEGQFRKYREMAKRLANGTAEDDTNATTRAKPTTPRAPRTPKTTQNNGVTKSGSGKRGAAAAASKKDKTTVSPTKSGKFKALLNVISLSETDSDGDVRSVKSETVGVEENMEGVKVEDDNMGVKALGFGSVPSAVNSQTNGYVLANDDDDVFGEDA